MKKKYLAAVVCVCMLLLSGCGCSIFNSSTDNNYKSYLVGSMNFEAPSDWKYNFENPYTYLYANDNDFIMIYMENVAETLDTDFMDGFESGMKNGEGVSDFKEISRERITISGKEGYKLVNTIKLKHQQTHCLESYLVKDANTYYVMSFNSLGDKQSSAYNGVEDRIVQSISFNENK